MKEKKKTLKTMRKALKKEIKSINKTRRKAIKKERKTKLRLSGGL